MTQAEILNLIDDELFMENIKTELTEQEIVWTDTFGAKNSVSIHQTAINNNGVIAWWQNNEAGKEQVRIRIDEKTFITWKPPINTLGQSSFSGGLLYFYENYLIIKYKDKHRERLFIFNITTLKAEEILLRNLTTQVKISGNELLLTGLYSDEDFIKITMHPDRIERESIDQEYIHRRNITLD